MATLRRLQSVLSCLLAVLLVGGTFLPSPALWQCHHSARVVDVAFAAPPSAMPCRMSVRMGGSMPVMACCPPERSVARRGVPTRQALSRPACRPTLTSLAVFPAAYTPETHAHLRQSLASMQAVLPLPATVAPSVPITLSLRQRPPPTVGQSQSVPVRTPGLRAPPAA